MKKEFESKFMPDIYFKLQGDISQLHDVIDMEYLKMGFTYFYTSYCGTKLFPVKEYQKQGLKKVSIYEAIPELVPDGMRYNKELDKLEWIITDKPGFGKCVSIKPINPEFTENNNVKTDDSIPEGMRYSQEFDKLVPDITPVDGFAIGGFVSNDYLEPAGIAHGAEDFYIEAEAEGNVVLKHLFSKAEKINKRENGFIKADLDKIDFTLVDPYAYKDLGKQLTIGAKKYSRDNWKKGDIFSYLAALERHINDVKIALEEDNIEKLIDDTGVNQGGALMFNAMAIHYFIRKILKKGKING